MRHKLKGRNIVAAALLSMTALGGVVLAAILFEAFAEPSPDPSMRTRPVAFNRAARPEDVLPAGTRFRSDDAINVDPLDSRLLLDNGAARYWIVLLPETQTRSICIVLQSIQAKHAGLSCVTPQQFAERGVGVVLKTPTLAHAGLIGPETAALPEGSIFESRGELIHLTVAASKAEQLVTDYAALKDEMSR